MKTFFMASIAFGALAVSAGSAWAQTNRVSEEEARCFVSGVCKIESEKKFSLANISTTAPRSSASVPASAPPARMNATSSHKAVRVASKEEYRPRPMSATRQSLDMRLSFDLNSAQLTPEAMAQADVFAKVLKESAAAPGTFLIEGNTDSIGSREYNLDLSRRRAQSVVRYLADRGVPSSKLKAVGYGFDHPRDGLPASDPSNRRVEIVKN